MKTRTYRQFFYLILCICQQFICASFLLYSTWDLIDDLLNLGTLGSFMPITNRHIFNKHTYLENKTRIEREWMDFSVYNICLRSEGSFTYSDKLQNIVHSRRREWQSWSCQIMPIWLACVLVLTEYRQWNYLCVCSLICHWQICLTHDVSVYCNPSYDCKLVCLFSWSSLHKSDIA